MSKILSISKPIPQTFKNGERNIFFIVTFNEIESQGEMLESLKKLFLKKNLVMASKSDLDSFNSSFSKKVTNSIKKLFSKESKIGIIPYDIKIIDFIKATQEKNCPAKDTFIGKETTKNISIYSFLTNRVGILLKKVSEKESIPTYNEKVINHERRKFIKNDKHKVPDHIVHF